MMQPNKKFNLTKLLFECTQTPLNTIAVLWDEMEITRAAVFENSLKTAHYLATSGVQEGDRVVLILDDTPAVYDFFLGAIVIGAIPVLINPKTKTSDIQYILNHSQATALISEIRPLQELETLYESSEYLTSRNSIIVQDRYVSDPDILRNNKEYFYPRSSKVVFIEDEDVTISFCIRDQDATAFWQYTSGTTGLPKAVKHSQIAMISNTLNFAQKTLGITNKDRIYSVPKMFFGYGLGNSLFFPLLLGATAILDDQWPNPKHIASMIKKHRPTVVFAVPKVYAALLNQGTNVPMDQIRIFYSAGSNLNASLNQRWKKWTGKHITQGIGCTEIGHVYISTIPGKEQIDSTGIPVPGFEVKLEGCEDQEMEELYVKPPFKLLGYHDTAQNDNKFLAGNWYRTSDGFTRDAMGSYGFSSRIDELFKVNSRMVVPSITENLALENDLVKEAVFLGVENKNNSDVSTCLCITLSDTQTNHLALIESLKREKLSQLPSYMQPDHIEVFENFEYNSNGKILKKRIKAQLIKLALVPELRGATALGNPWTLKVI